MMQHAGYCQASVKVQLLSDRGALNDQLTGLRVYEQKKGLFKKKKTLDGSKCRLSPDSL